MPLHSIPIFHSYIPFLFHSAFSDGEWDWDNYSLMVLTQRRDIPASAMAAVRYNIWCAVGNTVHVVQPHQIKMEVGPVVMDTYCMWWCLGLGWEVVKEI